MFEVVCHKTNRNWVGNEPFRAKDFSVLFEAKIGYNWDRKLTAKDLYYSWGDLNVAITEWADPTKISYDFIVRHTVVETDMLGGMDVNGKRQETGAYRAFCSSELIIRFTNKGDAVQFRLSWLVQN